MKKILFLFVFIVSASLCSAQQALFQVAKLYFRANPLDQEISSFLRQLLNDPTLINTSTIKRTDTSLFYFRGEYKYHNPFFFKAKRTEVVFAEKEVIVNDSLNIVDTVIFYQIVGYAGEGESGLKDVKQEFNRFDHKYIKKFSQNDITELKSNNAVYGAIRNYYLDNSYLSPLSVSWQQVGTTHENVFVITLRFKISGNVAVLPITANGP